MQGFLINCATYGFTSNYNEIMAGEYEHDLFYHTFAEKLMDMLGDFAFREVFTSDTIYRMEVAEATMIDYLMDRFVSAVIKYDDKEEKMGTLDIRMVSFISSNYKNAYHFQAQGKSNEERLYLRLLLVIHYLRNDRQLCEKIISGIKGNFIIAVFSYGTGIDCDK